MVAAVAVVAVTVLTADTAVPRSDAGVDAFVAAVVPTIDCTADPLDDSGGCATTEPSAFETTESEPSTELIEPVDTGWATAIVGKALLVVDSMPAATDLTVVAIPLDETMGVEPADTRLASGFRRFEGSAALVSDEEEVAAEAVPVPGAVEVAAEAATLPRLPVDPRRSVRVERGVVALVVVAAVTTEVVDALGPAARVLVVAEVAVDPRRPVRVEPTPVELVDALDVTVGVVEALDATAGVAVVAPVAVDPRRPVRVEPTPAELVDALDVTVGVVEALDATAGVAVVAPVAVDPRSPARVEPRSVEPVVGAGGVELVDALDVTAGVVEALDETAGVAVVTPLAVDPRSPVRVEPRSVEPVVEAAGGVELVDALEVTAGVGRGA